eukprot:m.147956 g.147956  ORF g.147956 m.147956 type:complete len:536 (+) comp16274_c0_seq13:1357-2964(+)
MMASATRCDDQSAAVAYLRESQPYHEYLHLDKVKVKVIETHSAYIFLINDSHAFKLEKSVWYPFMDMSCLEFRKKAAENEYYRNCDTSPEVYQRMVPLTRSSTGELQLGGEGQAVEWLIQMTQFKQEALLSHMAEHKELTQPLVDQLIDNVCDFHNQQEVLKEADFAATMRWIQEDNAHEMADFAKQGFADCTLVEKLSSQQAEQVQGLTALIQQRESAGLVRLCHGDLHLKNVVNIDGSPRLFDCIGFNDELAKSDIVYDLAFLLMDLLYRNEQTLANRSLNRYVQRTDDYQCLQVLPLYISFRATIRAKVACAEATSCHADPKRQDHLKSSCQKYLHLALSSLQAVSQARVVVIAGPSGTGKSTLASAIAPLLGGGLGAVHVRSDVVRKQQHHVAFETRLPAEAYSEKASHACYGRVADLALEMHTKGVPVVVDATFGSSARRNDFDERLKRAGVSYQGVWLHASKEVLLQRVAARDAASVKDASDMTAELLKTKSIPDAVELSEAWQQLGVEGDPNQVKAGCMDLLDLHEEP